MKLVSNARLAGLLALVIAAMLLSAPPAWAATSVADLTAPDGISIGADVEREIFGVNITGGGTWNTLTVDFAQVGPDSDFDPGDLKGNPDGLAVFRDNGPIDNEFDEGDDIASSGYTFTGLSAEVDVSEPIPDSASGFNFFITVKTSATIPEGTDFTMSVPGGLLGACGFHTSAPAQLSCTGGSSQEIVADTTAPTPPVLTRPTTVDGNVVWTFGEDVVGVNADSVVLRQAGVTVDAPVTYDATSHTATINPSDPLSPGLTYVTIVNPGTASSAVTDEAGNPVATTQEDFTLADVGFTPGVVRGNTWLLNLGYDATHDVSFAFGRSTDFPVVGDWNDDGVFTGGVVRGNVWFLNNDFDSTHDATFAFGRSTDFPVVGDWDGIGGFSAGIVRGNVWFLNNDFDSTHDETFAFGRSTDFPVVGDWDEDGMSTAGVVRGNVWFLNNDFDSTHDETFAFGRSTDFPVVGDWDDDGVYSPGVVRGNVWFLNNDFDTTHDLTFAFGAATDYPVVGDWDGP
jgi:hypothetical protein